MIFTTGLVIVGSSSFAAAMNLPGGNWHLGDQQRSDVPLLAWLGALSDT
jgi:hypothetical protein